MKARGTRIVTDVKRYSPAEVEAFVRDNAERLQPKKQDARELPAIPDLIMMKPGDPAMRPPIRLIVSNDDQRDALRQRHEITIAAEEFMHAETARLRAERQAEEQKRVAQAKAKRKKHLEGRQQTQVMSTDGRTHTVKRVKTTASKMVETGKLPRDLYTQLAAFAAIVARALGAAVEDGQDSTSRLTAQYEGVPGGTFGSKTLSDSVIDARTELREIGRLIPPEMQECFVQVVGEEVGSLLGKPLTLDQLGEKRGYHNKQASASGGTQVYDVVALLTHLAKLRGTLSRENINAVRQNAAEGRKSLSSQRLIAAE
jgi:hypothetical protein